MQLPVRIQRLRKKGFKVPPNTVYVGRPGKYGNPFKVVGDMIYVNAAHRRTILDPWVYLCQGNSEKCVRLFRWVVTGVAPTGHYGIPVNSLLDIGHWIQYFKEIDKKPLKNKNLMCWCKLGEPCHADVLLELVNANT